MRKGTTDRFLKTAESIRQDRALYIRKEDKEKGGEEETKREE